MRYVALLRGVNVTGSNMIKMSELKAAFEALGFTNVVTYINSGNVAFDSQKSTETSLVKRIAPVIEELAGKPISVMVREQKDILRVLENNPFDGRFESHKQMHVLFLRDEIPAERHDEILALQSDKEFLAIRGRELYLLLLCGFPESLLGRGLIERRLKIPVTVRNWRTAEKLAEL